MRVGLYRWRVPLDANAIVKRADAIMLHPGLVVADNGQKAI